MLQVFAIFESFWKSIKAYWKDKLKFKSKPGLPKYKNKIKGRNSIIFTSQEILVKKWL